MSIHRNLPALVERFGKSAFHRRVAYAVRWHWFVDKNASEIDRLVDELAASR